MDTVKACILILGGAEKRNCMHLIVRGIQSYEEKVRCLLRKVACFSFKKQKEVPPFVET